MATSSTPSGGRLRRTENATHTRSRTGSSRYALPRSVWTNGPTERRPVCTRSSAPGGKVRRSPVNPGASMRANAWRPPSLTSVSRSAPRLRRRRVLRPHPMAPGRGGPLLELAVELDVNPLVEEAQEPGDPSDFLERLVIDPDQVLHHLAAVELD